MLYHTLYVVCIVFRYQFGEIKMNTLVNKVSHITRAAPVALAFCQTMSTESKHWQSKIKQKNVITLMKKTQTITHRFY